MTTINDCMDVIFQGTSDFVV